MHNRFIIDDVIYWISDSYDYNLKGEVTNINPPIQTGVVASITITKIPSGIHVSYHMEEGSNSVIERKESRLFASEQEAKDHLKEVYTRNYNKLMKAVNG